MIQLWSPRHLVESWAHSAQLKARRNAMLASTSLAQRRAEQIEVEAFLRSLPMDRRHRRPAGA